MKEYVTFDQLRDELRKKPDLVKVVRCCDCKQMIVLTTDDLVCYYNEELIDGWCTFFRIGTYFNYFCSWGERRHDG